MNGKFVLGLAVVAILIAAVFYKQRGDHLDPAGSVLKVRSVAADEQHTIVVLDVRIHNNSAVPMNIRDISTAVETSDGRVVEGSLMSKSSTKQVFEYYPALGEMYNEVLLPNARIPPHATSDLMLAARFDLTEQQLAARRKLSVVVQDRSLLKFTLLEKHR